MRDPDFRFKQFSIWHDQCAMKVNTDGILLGAWSEVKDRSNILDIGTGTGLIALMMAQKSEYHGNKIVAVEIDSAAAKQAKFNFEQSDWSSQLVVEQQDIQSFGKFQSKKFDLIVSNPPYFSDSLKAPNKERNQARHNQNLTFDELLENAQRLATDNAEFNLILPCNEAERLLKRSNDYGWELKRQCQVSTVTGKQASRTLLTFSREKHTIVEKSELVIRNKDNTYTFEFTELCKNFYLFM